MEVRHVGHPVPSPPPQTVEVCPVSDITQNLSSSTNHTCLPSPQFVSKVLIVFIQVLLQRQEDSPTVHLHPPSDSIDTTPRVKSSGAERGRGWMRTNLLEGAVSLLSLPPPALQRAASWRRIRSVGTTCRYTQEIINVETLKWMQNTLAYLPPLCSVRDAASSLQV